MGIVRPGLSQAHNALPGLAVDGDLEIGDSSARSEERLPGDRIGVVRKRVAQEREQLDKGDSRVVSGRVGPAAELDPGRLDEALEPFVAVFGGPCHSSKASA